MADSSSKPTAETTDPDKEPAHQLWVELTTRITRQDLHARSGQEEAASNSVYQVFKKGRELMVEHPEATKFCKVTEHMLNQIMRPYTARWHGWMDADERFILETSRRQFRQELAELAEKLDKPTRVLAKMSGNEMPDPGSAFDDHVRTVDLLFEDDFAYQEIKGDPAYKELIEETEHPAIIQRRAACGRSKDTHGLSGLALSGGGIRSATFCLGIVTELAKRGVLSQTDYLSTVSGGGYLGAFITSTFNSYKRDVCTEWDPKNSPQDTCDQVFGKKGEQTDSQPVRHLRNSSKYLLNKGTWGFLLIKAMMLYGIALNLVTFSVVAMILAIAVWAITGALEPGDYVWPVCISGSLVAVACLVVPIVQHRCRGAKPDSGLKTKVDKKDHTTTNSKSDEKVGSEDRSSTSQRPSINPVRRYKWLSRTEGTAVILVLIFVAILGLASLPLMVGWAVEIYNGRYDEVSDGFTVLAGVGIAVVTLPFILAIIATVLKQTRLVVKLAYWSMAVAGFSVSLAVFLLTYGFFYHQGYSGFMPIGLYVVGGLLLFSIWGYSFVNINLTSPHRYYRNRLCECYLLVASQAEKRVGRLLKSLLPNQAACSAIAEDEPCFVPRSRFEFDEIDAEAAPLHLINATVNLGYERSPEMRGRRSDFFLFSKEQSGSVATDYHQTDDLAAEDPHLDLGTAVAISGAAASGQMGWKTPRGLEYLLVILNVRLGYWLRNPGKGSSFFFKPGPFHLLKEMTSYRMDSRASYLNVSDGGHIENLAIYELLRRQCRFIIAIEGGGQRKSTFSDMRRLQRYASIDLGCQISIDMSDVDCSERGFSKHHHALGTITYRNGQRGFLLYFRTTMTGDEQDHVHDYQRVCPSFPHQTTGDQFFDEAQFEAYRSLGQTAAELMFGQLNALKDFNPDGLMSPKDLFRNLAKVALPDNHEVFDGLQESKGSDSVTKNKQTT